ncbi:MAG TPA: ketoacyl-ACP synthase III family protein, partial [Dermatophilaceae bacterium]|nr:ketoacyl-ACP synthase III family protein [Dermatophilaceae bacterium]
HQGQEFWTPVNYVHNTAVGGHGAAIEIRQGSNGGLAGLELAASHLSSRPPGKAAVITTGDAFRMPYFDRWCSDSQQVYGDGAGALVVSSREGFARVRSTVSLTDSSLEPIYRGTSGWTDAPFADGKTVDLASRKASYLTQNEDGYDEVIGKMVANAAAVLKGVLADAETGMDDLDFFIHANIAETIAGFAFHQLLGVDRAKTTYDWGLDFGHMGAGDQIIGLDHLASTGQLKAGDLVGMMGVGVGFMWTAAVLEIIEAPRW